MWGGARRCVIYGGFGGWGPPLPNNLFLDLYFSAPGARVCACVRACACVRVRARVCVSRMPPQRLSAPGPRPAHPP